MKYKENAYCDALRYLVLFVQIKKREKPLWRSATFSNVAGTKSNTPPWVFFMFLKLYKWYQIVQGIAYINPVSLLVSNLQIIFLI